MVSETHFRLLDEKINIGHTKPKAKPWINIDSQKQISIENIYVWEINDGSNKIYRISIPGLAQNNYNDRVMIKGKQPEKHILGQYKEKNVTINMYPIIYYLKEEEQALYLQLLSSNNIRGCIEYLRKIETNLNLETKEEKKQEPQKVRVRLVKKGK